MICTNEGPVFALLVTIELCMALFVLPKVQSL